MITDNFIKQCEASEQIQEACHFYKGDWFFCKDERYEVLDDVIYGRSTANQFKKDKTWLPTLEQLFDIWSYLCNTNNKAHPEYLAGDHLPTRFFYRIYKELNRTNMGIWFDKTVCLDIIMRDFYNKIWTGEKWEEVK